MSIHIFSFDQDYPNSEEQLVRVQHTLRHLIFSDSMDIGHIANFLFVKRYDVSIKVLNSKVVEVIISKTPSKYTYGSLITI